MRLNTILAPLTFVMLVLTVFIVVDHIRTKSVASASTTTDSTRVEGGSEPSVGRSLLSAPQRPLVTGVSSEIPEASDYKQLNTVPWGYNEVGRLFRLAGPELSCQLLEPDADVVQPLIESVPGMAGPLGRQSAFSIRLQVVKTPGEGLSSVILGAAEDYLKAHQLTIQPTYYHDEQGQLIIGPRLRAAFVRLDSPEKATTAERMIEESIANLRTLGAYWLEDQPFTPASCRTMILGFRYTLDAASVVGQGKPKLEYELLFLHRLPESTVSKPKLAIFATSDARTQFHLLVENDPDSVEQLAAITADIRFADSRLGGMYPQAPVVTRVHHLDQFKTPVERVMSEITGLPGKAPVGGFSGVLDEYYRKITGTDAPASSGEPAPASTDAAPNATDTKPETTETKSEATAPGTP